MAHTGGALALLSLPEPVLESISQLLPQADRLNLAAACKALHRCSLRWFAQVNVKLPFDAPHKVAHLAAWLRHHPVPVHVELSGSPALAGTRGFTVAALSAARLTQLADAADVAPRVLSLSVSPLHQQPTLAEQLPAFTALESLDLSLGKLLGSVEAVWALPRLTRLSFDKRQLERAVAAQPAVQHWLNSNHTAVAATLPLMPGLTRLEVAHALPGTSGHWSSVRALSQLQTLVLNCARGAHVLQHLPPAPCAT